MFNVFVKRQVEYTGAARTMQMLEVEDGMTQIVVTGRLGVSPSDIARL